MYKNIITNNKYRAWNLMAKDIHFQKSKFLMDSTDLVPNALVSRDRRCLLVHVAWHTSMVTVSTSNYLPLTEPMPEGSPAPPSLNPTILI